mmetsp:Transcript_55355/g.118037  ORF Transcript_55355/g.118037 Transcript_55355/m.118037 type:complete len:707 (+) Transcript_55355:237-2357(+)
MVSLYASDTRSTSAFNGFGEKERPTDSSNALKGAASEVEEAFVHLTWTSAACTEDPPQNPSQPPKEMREPPAHDEPCDAEVGKSTFNMERARSKLGTGFTARKWRVLREEAWAELSFKVRPFLKSIFYEIWPVFIGGIFAMLIDGPAAARDRRLWPPTVTGFLLNDCVFLVGCFAPFIFPADGINILDSVTIALLWLAKAGTISTKYAFYGYGDLDGSNGGLGSDAYRDSRRLDRNLMGNFCANLSGVQLPGLLEQLYASTLLQDLQLSDLDFDCVHKEDAEWVWSEVSKTLRDATVGDLFERYDVDVNEENLQSLRVSNTMQIEEERNRTKELPAASTQSNLEPTISGRAGSTRICGKFEQFAANVAASASQNLEGQSLVELLLGESEAKIEAKAKQGKVSAAVVAIHCIVSCHHVPSKFGKSMISSIFLMAICYTGVHTAVNILSDLPGFGNSAWGIALFACQVWTINRGFMLATLYTVLPMKFFFSQRRVDGYLYGMLAGDLAVKAIWPPVFYYRSPRIDASESRNIAAWAALQRCLRGSGFAPNYQYRFNFYRIITFGVLVIDSLVHGRASAWVHRSPPMGSKVCSTLRLLTLTAAVTVELALGVQVNNFADRHVAYISKLRTSNTAMAATTRRQTQSDALLLAEHLLDVASQEILNTRASAPVTVATLKAEIARVSLLLTLVGLVIYEDLKVVQEALGFET